jgi:ribosomal protein S18 acetylase RimI-like enzyme
MIEIKRATEGDAEVLALLGRITYVESHGHFIDDKNDLLSFNNEAFSISQTKQDLKDFKKLFFIIYVDELPVGYAKLSLNEIHKSIVSQNNCRLDKIYILNDFIPLKIGQQLLTFLEKKAKELQLDTMWLCVYIKNDRAIRFYQKNEFKNVGELNFLVNGKEYENIIFSKNLEV